MKLAWPAWLSEHPALVVAVIYFTLSAIIGDWFPFTRVPMYANVSPGAMRHEAAVPQFIADGVEAPIEGFTRFHGGDPQDIVPWDRCRANGECRSYACSMSYIPENAVRWIQDHPSESDTPGPIIVSYRYQMITMEDGEYSFDASTVWEGTAWPLE